MTQPSALANSIPRWQLAAILAVTLLGTAWHIWIARGSLWVDELHTAWCTRGSETGVAPRAAIGNQSPPFFWLEWALVQLFGEHEWALRLPSLIAGSLLPLALCWLAWRWTNQGLVALTAAALVLIDPLSNFFATEARPYALV